jgi:hypothetical protein
LIRTLCLARTFAHQGFEPVARRDAQIVDRACRVDQVELALGEPLDVVRQPPGKLALIDFLGFGIPEVPDHKMILTSCVTNVKRRYGRSFHGARPQPQSTTPAGKFRKQLA